MLDVPYREYRESTAAELLERMALMWLALLGLPVIFAVAGGPRRLRVDADPSTIETEFDAYPSTELARPKSQLWRERRSLLEQIHLRDR
jgi:hypothetical protein